MKKATYLLSALLLAATTLFAQDHKHGSPHGGEVKTAGTGFHIEVLVKKGVLIVYLLDANEKTLSIAGATATALIQTANGKVSTSALKANGKANFIYHLSPAIKYNKAIITLKKGGKTASASFDLNKKTPGKASETAGHHH